MQIESEHMEIPEQHYKVCAKLPSAEFQKICRDLKEFGETLQKPPRSAAVWSWVWGLTHPCLSNMSWKRMRMGTCSSTWRPRLMSEDGAKLRRCGHEG